jgi:hypothetical protein
LTSEDKLDAPVWHQLDARDASGASGSADSASDLALSEFIDAAWARVLEAGRTTGAGWFLGGSFRHAADSCACS